MKTRTLFNFEGKYGGGVRAGIIAENERNPRVDSIRLSYRSSAEAKAGIDWHSLDLTPTEAYAMAMGLITATTRFLIQERDLE